jgi:hypothetical protein
MSTEYSHHKCDFERLDTYEQRRCEESSDEQNDWEIHGLVATTSLASRAMSKAHQYRFHICNLCVSMALLLVVVALLLGRTDPDSIYCEWSNAK